MAVPKFFEFFEIFLNAINDDRLHTAKEVREIIAGKMNLTQADIAEMSPSGGHTKFEQRVSWAKTYLNKAGLIETPQKGKYRITEAGRKALQSGEKIDVLTVAKTLKEKYNSSVNIVISGNYRLGDIKDNIADLTKIKDILNYEPKVFFKEGISRFVDWVETQEVGEDNYNKSIEEMKAKGLYK